MCKFGAVCRVPLLLLLLQPPTLPPLLFPLLLPPANAAADAAATVVLLLLSLPPVVVFATAVVFREWQGFSYPSGVEGKGTWGSGWGSSCLDPHTPVPLNKG